ncbi:DinB family protein [Gracilibacillus caseinilyticus]|uniref:DinB family protein n=1 Tax=Gracilibacillus caseinilyticus TaxID=2932256 RepID=A0ABY4F2R1_9BACI|nr:DinB family protein [Gracilibacillus caseinilyticus]UOQ50159.1 DinB family protein [Gracilibacillus caseinilyticus]
MLVRPEKNEYPAPYKMYIRLVPEGDLIDILEKQMKQTLELLRNTTNKTWQFHYAPSKWCLKEVIGHIIDNEIMMHYRILRISRGDHTPLFGYDQTKFVSAANFEHVDPKELINYYKNIRQLTISTYKTIMDEAWLYQGTMENMTFSARSFAYISAGHECHHLHIIKEKYLQP